MVLRKPTSSSIPTEMKNRLVKTSLKGRMPSRTLRLYSDPEAGARREERAEGEGEAERGRAEGDGEAQAKARS